MSVQAVEVTRRGRRIYSVAVQDRARELHEARWPLRTITEILAREFAMDKPPRANTVNEWVNPKLLKQRRAEDRVRHRHHRQADFSYPGRRSPEWKVGRMRALDAAGLSCAAIAKVMAVDFPDDPSLTDHQVRYALARSTATSRRTA